MLTERINSSTDSYKYFSIINTILYSENYHKTNKKTERIIDKHLAYRYQGNFFGLLNELGIDPKFHMFILYFNGYTSPYQYTGDNLTIYLPNLTSIENNIALYENT